MSVVSFFFVDVWYKFKRSPIAELNEIEGEGETALQKKKTGLMVKHSSLWLLVFFSSLSVSDRRTHSYCICE